ncbi:hypothetical protein Tco_0340200 [Tanacetum coccineum]
MGEYDGITTLIKSILDGFTLRSFSHGRGDFLEERATGSTNIKQRLLKVVDGYFTATVKVLSSSGVDPYYGDTIKVLEAKHPYKPPSSMPSIKFYEPPLVPEIYSVFGCINSFLKGTLCERDGLRAQHILDALCGEGFATATYLFKVITSVVTLLLAGRYLPILAEFVACAPLTPLLKLDNRILPITACTIWRHLVFKVSMKGVDKEMSKSLAMLTVDFSNAFNLVDRSALLYEQGDPLGPLCFAFILHPLLHKIKYRSKLHAWYHDDGTVIGDSEEVAKMSDIIKVSGPSLGLELNIKKTEIVWPLGIGIKLHEGLSAIDIQRPSSGVKLLVGAVSRDTYFISGLAIRRVTNVVDLMSLLLQLHDLQSELLLLRSCMGIAKLFFGLRTCQPVHKGVKKVDPTRT